MMCIMKNRGASEHHQPNRNTTLSLPTTYISHMGPSNVSFSNISNSLNINPPMINADLSLPTSFHADPSIAPNPNIPKGLVYTRTIPSAFFPTAQPFSLFRALPSSFAEDPAVSLPSVSVPFQPNPGDPPNCLTTQGQDDLRISGRYFPQQLNCDFQGSKRSIVADSNSRNITAEQVLSSIYCSKQPNVNMPTKGDRGPLNRFSKKRPV